MSALKLLSRTKLYWGLIAIFLIGVLGSPISSKGNNIFLSYGNLLDVLRQVSTTGLIATGMTAVIITGGIDLSVGSVVALAGIVSVRASLVADCPAPSVATRCSVTGSPAQTCSVRSLVVRAAFAALPSGVLAPWRGSESGMSGGP